MQDTIKLKMFTQGADEGGLGELGLEHITILSVIQNFNHWANTTYTDSVQSLSGGESVTEVAELVQAWSSAVVVAQWLMCLL